MYKPRTTPADKNSPRQKRSASLALSKVHRILDAQPALVSDPQLSHEIEKALTVESADMVLVTLRRIDECILIAPHMVAPWKKLLERLVQLNPAMASKYCAEMSLYWDPYYAQRMIEEIRSQHAWHLGLENYISFIEWTQMIGNELDAHGINTWMRLMQAKVDQEPIEHILNSILLIFPTSIFSKGYCRKLDGVSFSIWQSRINPDFRKCAAETYLSILAEFIPEHPEEGVSFISWVMSSLLWEDYPGIMEKFFECWKSCIQYIAQKDPEDAISYIDGDTDFSMFQNQKRILKWEISSNISRITVQSRSDTLPQNAFEAAQMWCLSKNRKQATDVWRKIILQWKEKNPEFAVREIYASIAPFSSMLKETDWESFLAQQLTDVLTSIIDSVAEEDPLRALRICFHVLREEHYALVYFSQQALSQRIIWYTEQLSVSHPDLVLDGYVLIDRSIQWSNQWGVPGMEYMSGVEQRHWSMLDLIPRAAQKSLLIAIDACERLLMFSEDTSEIHEKTLDLWRTYMKQLEKRHTATARIRYSDFHAMIKDRQHPLAREADAGYERCCANAILQSRTVLPIE